MKLKPLCRLTASQPKMMCCDNGRSNRKAGTAAWKRKSRPTGRLPLRRTSKDELDDPRIAPFAEKVNGNRYHVE